MAILKREDVLYLARLARLELSDDEISEFQRELSDILAYVEQLQQADTTGLKPTDQVGGLTNINRTDVIKDYGYPPFDLMDNVPRKKDGQIIVNRMVK